MSREVEFWVTICLGHGDGGDVAVKAEVSDEEYELMKACCREGDELEFCEELEPMCERVIAAARDESVFCSDGDEDEYDDAAYTVQIPDEVCDAVEKEDHPADDAGMEARAVELLKRDDDFEMLDTFVEENEDRYTGELKEYVFRQAVRTGNIPYIRQHCDDIDLNDEGGYSTYLDDAANEEVEALLLEAGAFWSWDHYCDCRFAMETICGTVLACDDDLLDELREKYLAETGLTEEDIRRMLEDEKNIPEDFGRDFEEDIRGLCWSLRGGRLYPENPTGEEGGWVIRELLKEFGWEFEFEGDAWKFETNGVYFIK